MSQVSTESVEREVGENSSGVYIKGRCWLHLERLVCHASTADDVEAPHDEPADDCRADCFDNDCGQR